MEGWLWCGVWGWGRGPAASATLLHGEPLTVPPLARLPCVQEVPGEALLPGDIASIGRPKGGAGAEDKVVPAGEEGS